MPTAVLCPVLLLTPAARSMLRQQLHMPPAMTGLRETTQRARVSTRIRRWDRAATSFVSHSHCSLNMPVNRHVPAGLSCLLHKLCWTLISILRPCKPKLLPPTWRGHRVLRTERKDCSARRSAVSTSNRISVPLPARQRPLDITNKSRRATFPRVMRPHQASPSKGKNLVARLRLAPWSQLQAGLTACSHRLSMPLKTPSRRSHRASATQWKSPSTR
jgi:hypothetical protein